jgi:anti-sigma regulatory factor (Ser/Thr protein kinase)
MSAPDDGVEVGLVEINIPSRVDLVAVVRMVVAAATNAVEALHGDRLDDLRWVTSEATTNAIQANLSTDNGDGRVAVTCEVDNGFVRLAVKDEGPGMPEQYEVPDITHPDRLLIEGAFGVPLMERLSTACRFVSADTGTTVQMELYQ